MQKQMGSLKSHSPHMLPKDAANLVASYGAEALLAFGGVKESGVSNESLMRVARTPPKLLPGPIGHPAQSFAPEYWESAVKPASIEMWKNVLPLEDLQPTSQKLSSLWKDINNDTRLALVLASVPRVRLWQKAVAVPAGGDPGDPDALWSPQVAACMLTLPEAQALHEAVQKHNKFQDAWTRCIKSGKACAHALWAIASAFSDNGNLLQLGYDRFKHEAPKATNDIMSAVMKLSNTKFEFGELEKAVPKDIIGAPLSCTGRIPWFCFVTIFRQNDACPTSPLCVGSKDGKLTQDKTPFMSIAQTPCVLEPFLIACKMQNAQQTKLLKKIRPAQMIKLKISPLQSQTAQPPLRFKTQGEFIGPSPPEKLPQAVAISTKELKLQKNQVNPGKSLCAIREKGALWAHVSGAEGTFKIEGGFVEFHKGDKFGLVQCEKINPFALSRNKGKAVPISACSISATGTTLALWLKKHGGGSSGGGSADSASLKFVDPVASAALFGLSALKKNVRPLGSIEGTLAKYSALAQSLVLGAATKNPISLGWVPSNETLVFASESGKVHTPLPLHGVRVVPCDPVNGLPVVKEASDVFDYAELQPFGCESGKFRVLKANVSDVDPSQMCFINPEDPRHQAALERAGTHTGKGELALCDSKIPLPPSCTEWIEMLEELESSCEVFWAAVKQLKIEPNATEISCVILPNKFT